MAVESRQTYLNTESGLLIETLFSGPHRMKSCGGRKVKIEEMELDFVRVDGRVYRRIGTYLGLDHLQVVTLEDRVGMVIEATYGEENEEAWEEEQSCSGYLWALMQETENPEETIRNFVEDFCGGCDKMVCLFHGNIVEEFVEELKL